jgi:hypothetical protein
MRLLAGVYGGRDRGREEAFGSAVGRVGIHAAAAAALRHGWHCMYTGGGRDAEEEEEEEEEEEQRRTGVKGALGRISASHSFDAESMASRYPTYTALIQPNYYTT